MYMTGNFQNLYRNGKQIVSPSATTPGGATQPGANQGGLPNPGAIADKTVLNISNFPIAAILQGLGGTYEWNAAEQKATIRWNGMTVELWNGQKTIKVNGVAKEVDIAPNVGTTTSIKLPSKSAANKPVSIISWEEGSIQIWDSIQRNMPKPPIKK